MSRIEIEFPRVIGVGQTKATVYLTPANGCGSCTMGWYEGSVRKRWPFADAGWAGVYLNSHGNNLGNGFTRRHSTSAKHGPPGRLLQSP